MKRWSRASSLGALVLVAAVGATASPVTATAAPAAGSVTASMAPRNEMAVVAPAGAVLSSSYTDTVIVDPAATQVSWSEASTGAGIQLGTYNTEPFKVGTFEVGSATGKINVAGGSNGNICSDSATARVTIHEATYTGEELTTLSATAQTNCGGVGETVFDLRFNSTAPAIRLGSVPLGTNAAPRTLTFTAPEATTVADLAYAGDLQGDIANDTCTGATLAAAQTCSVSLTARTIEVGGEYAALAIRDAAGKRLDTITVSALGTENSAGAYTPLTSPKRLLDTRTNNTPLKGGVSRDLMVLGTGGVPGGGVASVVVNITVVSPTASGNLRAYPAGLTPPNTSSVNFNKGWTGANLVTVRPGSGGVNGKIRMLTSGGSTHVIVDVVGYYRSAAGWTTTPRAFGSFHPEEPYRLYDSRAVGQPKVNGYEIFDLTVDYGSEMNATIKGLALNVTVVAPEGAGYVTVWNGLNSSTVPTASTLNFTTGRTVPNMTVTPVTRCFESWCNPDGTGPVAFTVANGSSRKVHVIVDVVGIFDDNTVDGGSRLKPLATPKRILDSRYGQGFTTLGPQVTKTASAAEVTNWWTTSLSGNLTAAAPTAASAITIWNSDFDKPGVSSLNPYAGQFVSNMAMPGVSGTSTYSVNNGGNGNANVIFDVVGTFDFYRTGQFPPEMGIVGGTMPSTKSGSGARTQGTDESKTLGGGLEGTPQTSLTPTKSTATKLNVR